MRKDDLRRFHRVLLGCGVALLLGLVAGCRVNTEDLKRWQSTEHGPDKLVAVLTHDKYERELRVDAAWSLIEMKKRGGQAVGLTRLIEELERMPLKDRSEIIDGLWKKLQPKVAQPLQSAGEGRFIDPSVVYKDATFSLYGDDRLDFDARIHDEMARALTEWAIGKDSDPVEKRLQTYETRMDNASQQFGVEQVLRKLGVTASSKLPLLLTAKSAIKSQRLDAIARVVIDVKPQNNDKRGQALYQKAREELSIHFARLLDETMGSGYIDAVRDEIVDALKKNPQGQQVLSNPDALKKYFENVRNERLSYLFSIVKQVGGKPVIAVLTRIATDEKSQKDHRALALAAMEGNVDTSSEDALKGFLAVARSSTAPDEVKHGALLRITAYPPERAVKAFYELFESSNWKVRYDGAMSILSIMQRVGTKAGTTPKEFLEKLPQKAEGTGPGGQKMGLGEPSAYGLMLSQLPKELSAPQAIMDALNSKSIGAQLTALGWYLSVGNKNDLPLLAKWEADKAPIPRCKEDDECGWDKPGCPVPKANAKPDEPPEWKSIATVGDYVQFCVKPQIELRAKQGSAPEAPK